MIKTKAALVVILAGLAFSLTASANVKLGEGVEIELVDENSSILWAGL